MNRKQQIVFCTHLHHEEALFPPEYPQQGRTKQWEGCIAGDIQELEQYHPDVPPDPS